MEQFRKLGISEPVLKSIQELKFEKPSEIQEKSIPLILEGKDVIAGAATGSGKTLAFAAGIIKNVESGKGLQALILTPTRELAEQVSKSKQLEIIAVYGGVSINPQIRSLRTAEVVVGTPGRMLDHMERGTIDLDRVKILVLDEADRMLDMGFKDDVEKIIEQCPTERQTLLFSATIFGEVSRLARKYMNDPVEVSAEAYVDPSKMAQCYYDVEDNQKFSLLVHLLKHERSGLTMVFCNTKRNTDFVAGNLITSGLNALAIHGGHSQEKRNSAMQRFSSQNVAVLVCTDVAARGLDIKGVSHIYNYDIPKDSKDYIHRIGRTARAGKDGKVINIVARRDDENFNRIVRDNENFDIVHEELPKIERIFIKFTDHNARRGGFGGREYFRRGNDFRGSGSGSRGGSYGGGSRSSSGSEHPRPNYLNRRFHHKIGEGENSRFGNPNNFRQRRDGDGEDRSDRGHHNNRRGGRRNFSRSNSRPRGRY
jgi:superfamily II DNA/RNA helicase